MGKVKQWEGCVRQKWTRNAHQKIRSSQGGVIFQMCSLIDVDYNMEEQCWEFVMAADQTNVQVAALEMLQLLHVRQKKCKQLWKHQWLSQQFRGLKDIQENTEGEIKTSRRSAQINEVQSRGRSMDVGWMRGRVLLGSAVQCLITQR